MMLGRVWGNRDSHPREESHGSPGTGRGSWFSRKVKNLGRTRCPHPLISSLGSWAPRAGVGLPLLPGPPPPPSSSPALSPSGGGGWGGGDTAFQQRHLPTAQPPPFPHLPCSATLAPPFRKPPDPAPPQEADGTSWSPQPMRTGRTGRDTPSGSPSGAQGPARGEHSSSAFSRTAQPPSMATWSGSLRAQQNPPPTPPPTLRFRKRPAPAPPASCWQLSPPAGRGPDAPRSRLSQAVGVGTQLSGGVGASGPTTPLPGVSADPSGVPEPRLGLCVSTQPLWGIDIWPGPVPSLESPPTPTPAQIPPQHTAPPLRCPPGQCTPPRGLALPSAFPEPQRYTAGRGHCSLWGVSPPRPEEGASLQPAGMASWTRPEWEREVMCVPGAEPRLRGSGSQEASGPCAGHRARPKHAVLSSQTNGRLKTPPRGTRRHPERQTCAEGPLTPEPWPVPS